MDGQGLRKYVHRQNRDGTVLRKAPSFPDSPARFHALGRNGSMTGRTPGTCLPETALLWKRKMQRMPEGKEETRTSKKAPAGRRRNQLLWQSPAAAGKPGTCKDRRFNGCLPWPYRIWFRSIPWHGHFADCF